MDFNLSGEANSQLQMESYRPIENVTRRIVGRTTDMCRPGAEADRFSRRVSAWVMSFIGERGSLLTLRAYQC